MVRWCVRPDAAVAVQLAVVNALSCVVVAICDDLTRMPSLILRRCVVGGRGGGGPVASMALLISIFRSRHAWVLVLEFGPVLSDDA
jgi:hypothetical protein